jgi:hypothetical protein
MISTLLKTMIGLILFISSHSAIAANEVELSDANWKYEINPSNLEIIVTNKHDNVPMRISNGMKPVDEVTQLQVSPKRITWYYPEKDIQIVVSLDAKGLVFNFMTHKEQVFEWPVAGLSSQANALVIPAGEGLYVPTKDPFWINEFKKYSSLSLLLPFLAVQYNHQYVSYLTPNNERMDYAIRQTQGQLYLTISHAFLKRDHFPIYTVYIHLTGHSPIHPALDYRQWLIDHHQFASLKEKMAQNQNIRKLLGAFHVWVWGDGKNLAMLRIFESLNIQHLWIGYDPSPAEKWNVTQDYVSLAKKLGYLIAPYDSFDNAQDPKTADNINSIWKHDLWPQGCIRNQDGSILVGFAGRGCYLSSEAFRLREATEKNIEERINTLTALGNNSYFLDVDAASPLFDDYANDHTMTEVQDKTNRLERMKYVSDARQLVLGSESGLAWANPVISYNNGSFSTFNEAFWPILNDKEHFGGWFPSDAPQLFFKPFDAPQAFITASYDPRYRVPLYEAVLHDSIVSTDRWELNELKIPAIRQTKALLESLYNVPAIWVLNIDALKNNARQFKHYYQFFSPLHRVAGLEPLTSFAWLSEDRLVQQTQFGKVLVITANFSKHHYRDIGSLCVKAVWLDSGKSSFYCPEK